MGLEIFDLGPGLGRLLGIDGDSCAVLRCAGYCGYGDASLPYPMRLETLFTAANIDKSIRQRQGRRRCLALS